METPVKEHGLMLSDAMVLARYNERKTQTRRLIGPSNTYVDGRRVSPKQWKAYGFDMENAWSDIGPSPAGNPGPYVKAESKGRGYETMVSRLYPIYQPGDRIWWREKHAIWERPAIQEGDQFFPAERGVYYASEGAMHQVPRWRPSIHMPRWAARYVDKVVHCSPERLSEVSDDDAKAEGVVWNDKLAVWCVPGVPVRANSPRGCYLKLMQHLHGDGIVEEDPWVWVITYRFGA